MASKKKANRRTAVKYRAIQKKAAQAEKRHPREKSDAAMQAGAREYPAPPFPKQHLPKPGKESQLDPAPLYDAPFYKGSEKLKDRARRILSMITGADVDEANRLLRQAKWNVKAAIVMKEAGVSYSQAIRQLRKADDSIRDALGKDLALSLPQPEST